MKTKYFIYLIDEESHLLKNKAILIKVQNQDLYDGFDSQVAAENWIRDSGMRQVTFTIIQEYRNP